VGWKSIMTVGMRCGLGPKYYEAMLWSRKLAEVHFWDGTPGILFYIVSIYAAGVPRGLMWRAFDESGRLAYPDFVETVTRILPMYWVRAVGGAMFVAGIVMCFVNLLMTWRSRPAKYEEPVHEAPPLGAYTGAVPRLV